jgi:elongation factor P
MATTYAGGLKKGDFVMYQGQINYIAYTEKYSPGKGASLMRTKLKNVINGKQVDYSYKTNEDVELLDVNVDEMQYLYKDTEYLYFMNPRTYEQVQLMISVVGESSRFLQENTTYYVYVYNEQALNMRPPQSAVFKVTYTEDAVKGDTTGNAKKPATLENGVDIMVPLFIKIGDKVKVDPETATYGERVND